MSDTPQQVLLPHALITEDELLTHLQVDEDPAFSDVRIEAINAASEEMAWFAETEFVATSDEPATRRFSYDGFGWLRLAPLSSLRDAPYAVVLEGRTLSADEVSGRPLNTVGGAWGLLKVPFTGTPSIVSITGMWGLAEVPASVRRLCCVQCAIWLAHDIANHTSTYNVSEDVTQRPENLSSSVRASLRKWKTPVVI